MQGHRRWLRYNLRTFFLLLTLFCVWLAAQVKWIRDRREVLRHHLEVTDDRKGHIEQNAPWRIRILGERGIHGIWLQDGTSESERVRITGLFPEAKSVERARPFPSDSSAANDPIRWGKK